MSRCEGAKEKEATPKEAFTFHTPYNEQTSDEIGQKARKRGFASLKKKVTGKPTVKLLQKRHS